MPTIRFYWRAQLDWYENASQGASLRGMGRATGRPIAMKSPKRVLKAFSRINVPGDCGLGRGDAA